MIRDGDLFSRCVAGVAAFSVLWLSLYPALLTAQHVIEDRSTAGMVETSSHDQLNGALVSLEEQIRTIGANAVAGESATAAWEAIEELESSMHEMDSEIVAAFDEVGSMIVDRDLPDAIVERHVAAVAVYKDQFNAVIEDLDKLRNEKNRKKRAKFATEFADRMGAIKKKRNQQHFDPTQLPARSMRPDSKNKPKVTAAEFIFADPMGDGRQLVANTGPSSPTGDDAFNNPDWLGESDEIKLTQPVIDKAVELQNDPVKIYHWVRNNILWNPNWGAKQTAQLTLELGSGNAMDIAGLTIGLMRAAGIPSRYVHGTIVVPEEQFRNWAGGFEDANAALVYGASGGIPMTALTNSGKISKALMEHVWVEIAVDYIPSRAAKNIEPDSWIAIDPSFKQYDYTDRIDQLAISGLNTGLLGQDYLGSGVISVSEGWLTGLDSTILDNARIETKDAVDAFIQSNIPNPTVGDAFGTRNTIIQDFPALADALPNRIVIDSAKYASIPDALQQKIRFGLGTNIFGQIDNSISLPWADVNNRKITLAFTPATTNDVAVLDALLPDGEPTDTSQLPNQIPAYLIDVIPELRLDDVVIATGNVISLGEEVEFHFNPTLAGLGELPYRYSVISGSYLSIAAIANGVSGTVFDAVDSRLDQAAIDILGPPSVSAGIQRDEIMGDLFYAGLLGYYANYVSYANILGAGNRDQTELTAGLGSIGYEPKLESIFGIPRAISPGSIFGDLPLVRVVGVNESSSSGIGFSSNKDFNFMLGLVGSVLEHAVAENLFADVNSPPIEAMSAVKAITIAADEGQRIYQINQSNLAGVIDQLNHNPATISEIQNAVSAGMEAIIHTDPVSNAGFFGAGYILFDPATGDGAFKITGGANGFFIVLLIAFIVVISMLALHAFAAGTLFSLTGFLIGFELLTFFSWIDDIKEAESEADLSEAHSRAAFMMILPFLWGEAAAVFGVSHTTITLGFGAIFTKMIQLVLG